MVSSIIIIANAYDRLGFVFQDFEYIVDMVGNFFSIFQHEKIISITVQPYIQPNEHEDKHT